VFIKLWPDACDHLRHLKTIFSLFFCGLLLGTCANHDSIVEDTNNNIYLKDTSISKPDGTPKDRLTFYFPFFRDTSFSPSSLDTFYQNKYSSALFAFTEPILYNYYLGHDMYRCLWLRAFEQPIVIVLHRNKDQVWLTTKKLDKEPQFFDWGTPQPKKVDNGTLPVDTPATADRTADIVYTKTLNLTLAEWNKVDTLLHQRNFWSMPPIAKPTKARKGSEWIIEAHLQDRYHFVQRWAPNETFRSIGECLINLSGLKEEIY
jgi:hypothetical protein